MIVGKVFEFSSKPEQPGLSSSICLEVMIELTQHIQICTYRTGKNLNTDIYRSWVHMSTTSERIELESPGCSGFEALKIVFQTWATRTF